MYSIVCETGLLIYLGNINSGCVKSRYKLFKCSDTNCLPYIWGCMGQESFHADILFEDSHRDNQIQCLLSTCTLQWLLIMINIGKFN